MAGKSDYLAQATMNFVTGNRAMPALASRFMALFTTAPTSDAGTGGTEVSGGAYARVQIAGALTAGAAFTTASTTLTLSAAAPAWLLALGTNGSGCNVWDATTGSNVGTVSSISGTTVTLSAVSAITSSGSADSLIFSAFAPAVASSGAEPATVPGKVQNAAQINFAQSSASWGTIQAWGIYDAATSGNLLEWDWTGGGSWSPFSCTLASPGVLTVNDQTFVNGNTCVVTAKFGGTLPTTAGSWSGPLTVAGVSGQTFNLGVNTTSAGDGSVRPIIQYTVGISTTFSFAANQCTLTDA